MRSSKDWRTDLINAVEQRYNRAIQNKRKVASEWKITLQSLQKSRKPIYLDTLANPIGLPKEISNNSWCTLCRIMWRKENVDLPPITNKIDIRRKRIQEDRLKRLNFIIDVISDLPYLYKVNHIYTK